jgi:hypothetical protein
MPYVRPSNPELRGYAAFHEIPRMSMDDALEIADSYNDLNCRELFYLGVIDALVDRQFDDQRLPDFMERLT